MQVRIQSLSQAIDPQVNSAKAMSTKRKENREVVRDLMWQRPSQFWPDTPTKAWSWHRPSAEAIPRSSEVFTITFIPISMS